MSCQDFLVQFSLTSVHPILSDRKKHLLYLSIWGAVGILGAVILSSFNGMPFWYILPAALPISLLYGEMNLSAWYLCRAFPLVKTPMLTVLSMVTASSVIMSGAWTVMIWGVLELSGDLFPLPLSPLPPGQSLLIVFITGLPFFVISLAVGYLLNAFEQSAASERSAYEARLLAQNAELKALRMQIDPHFLFNSLNSISALTATNAELARKMTTTLAEFFRKSLADGAKESIPLREELALLEHYLAIEKIRFGKRLTVELRSEPDAAEDRVPPLIIQPLVENAIKHGIAGTVEGGTVAIAAQKKSGRLFITVENPRDEETLEKKGAGMGLEIVRQRLQKLYGSDGGLMVERTPAQFRVIIFFPVERKV